jgi:hypothetical protein
VREAVQEKHGRTAADERDVHLDSVGGDAAKFGFEGPAGGVRGGCVAGGRDGWQLTSMVTIGYNKTVGDRAGLLKTARSR